MATKFDYLTITDAGDECFAVEVKIGKRWFAHEGPKDYAFFTREQAERLAGRIQTSRGIDLAHWYPCNVTEGEIAERWAVDAMERR